MITRYNIIDRNDHVYETVNSLNEADEYISHMKSILPEIVLTYQEIKISLVKSGFGRDPDLH